MFGMADPAPDQHKKVNDLYKRYGSIATVAALLNISPAVIAGMLSKANRKADYGVIDLFLGGDPLLDALKREHGVPE